MPSYSTFFQLLRKNEMMGAPHPKVEGKKPHIFQHCIFKFAQYTISFIQVLLGFFSAHNCFTLSSYHKGNNVAKEQ